VVLPLSASLQQRQQQQQQQMRIAAYAIEQKNAAAVENSSCNRTQVWRML
jgi:hypothetical protein